MSRLPPRPEPLRNHLGTPDRFLYGRRGSVRLRDLVAGTAFGERLGELSGRSVLLSTENQLAAAVALIEMDGIARRMILCPPDVEARQLPGLAATGGVDAVVSDREGAAADLGVEVGLTIGTDVRPGMRLVEKRHVTEWVLLTSGTTGVPKMLAHTLSGLTGAIRPGLHAGEDVVWGTFYDIRRYGGLQIFLRAVLGNGSLVLSDAGESPGDQLQRLAERSVTHLTGTPSHWRRALMSPWARTIRPRYVRLSGEIADQAVLNMLAAAYPEAGIGHAYASTEAGVVFEVTDGLEGFPESYIGNREGVEVIVENDALLVRSNRVASGYVGEPDRELEDDQGFVETGDMVERRGNRFYFLGRRSGVINVGGQKVYPEEVEAVLTRHPAVRMARVSSRRNPITGSLVAADVVLETESMPEVGAEACESDSLRSEILDFCRHTLARHKVPAALKFVPFLDVAATGKVLRNA